MWSSSDGVFQRHSVLFGFEMDGFCKAVFCLASRGTRGRLRHRRREKKPSFSYWVLAPVTLLQQWLLTLIAVVPFVSFFPHFQKQAYSCHHLRGPNLHSLDVSLSFHHLPFFPALESYLLPAVNFFVTSVPSPPSQSFHFEPFHLC